MDVAEMKVAGKAKGAAKPDPAQVAGGALATLVVNWAWKEAEAEEKRAGKLALFVKDIVALPDEASHRAFREQLSAELAGIAELEKVSGINESRKAGYSLASFRVMISNFRTISEAAQIGFKGTGKGGVELTWVQSLETAREYRKAHVSAGGTQTTQRGHKLGAGRKALSDYDKAIRVLSKLNLRDLRKVQAYVNGQIEAAEVGKRKPAAVH